MPLPHVYLVRHGETEWSKAGRHTSRTDLPLTPEGERAAVALGEHLCELNIVRAWSSPLLRARRSCELAGFGPVCEVVDDLSEWDYGELEGLQTPEIVRKIPEWNFTDGFLGGETPDQIVARADRVVQRLRGMEGNTVLFSHGHFLRVLAVRWVRWPVKMANDFGLDTASLGRLSFEHESKDEPIIAVWNATLRKSAPAERPRHL